MINKINTFKNNEGAMKYFKNTTWLIIEKIFRLVVGFLVGVWVARYLGPEQFGLFSYAQSFVGLFIAISSFGLDNIVVRELLKDGGNKDEIVTTVFILKLIGAFFVLIFLAITVNFTSNDDYTNVLIFIIASAIIFQSFNVIDFYFQSKVLSKYIVFANIISLLISSLTKILFIFYEFPLIYFAGVVLFDSMILALGYIYFYIKHNKFIKINNLKFNKNTAILLLKDSWPLMLSGLIISIYMKIDQVMIKEILGNEAVGQYSAAVRLSETWYFIPSVIAASLFPAIVSAKKQNEEFYIARLQKLYNFMVWLAIPITLFITFSADWLITILYGHVYREAGGVLVIHIWTSVFVFIGVVFAKYLTIENWTKKSFYRTLYGAIINIILNYILIPIYGIYGAAIATLIAQIVTNYLYDIFDKDLHKSFYMKTKSLLLIS
ncbi:MAG: flippase [Halarcobacter sp.]